MQLAAWALEKEDVMTSLKQSTLTREKEEVKKALKHFYRGVEQLLEGNPKPLYELWSHREDAINLGPFDQFIKGWSAIRQEIDRQSQMKMASGQSFKRGEAELILGNDLAITYGSLTGKIKDPQGKSHTIKLRESIVFSKEDGEWKILGLHVDRLPFDA